MKKIFFLMLALLGCAVQGWADKVTDLSQLDNDKVYTIRSARAFLLYSEAEGVANTLCTSNGKKVCSVTYSLTDPNQQFRIGKNGANYYLFSVGAGKYVNSNGNYEANASSALTFTKVSGSYPWKLCIGGNGMNSQEPGQMPAGIVVNSWTTADAGNCYQIEAVTLDPVDYTIHILGTENAAAGVTYNGAEYKEGGVITTDEVLKKADFTANEVAGKFAVVNIDGRNIYVSYFEGDTKFYTIQNGKGGYVSMNLDYRNGATLMLSNKNTPRDNQGLWAFVEQSKDVYKVYNYSTGLSKVLGMTGTEANARAMMVDPATTSYKIEFDGTFNFGSTTEPSYIKQSGTTSQYWNDRNSYLALWNSTGAIGDTGSKFFLDEADVADYPDEYIHEISEIQGVSSFSPKNPNTLWYTTSAEAAGVSYPWMEYALPLGNGELGCMVFGGVRTEELQFNEKTLWSGPANVVGAGGGNRTFMNFGSLFIANNDNAVYEGVTDYRARDIGIEPKVNRGWFCLEENLESEE